MSDKDVIFVSLELHEGEIIEIGMIFVNPYTLSEKEKGGTEARFLVKPKNLSTFTDRGPIKMQDLQSAREFKDIQGEIFMKLNDQTWISHQESHSVPQVLTKAFENIGVKAPEAKCILNTHDLLCDAKFDQRTSMSIDGLCKFFGLKKPDRNSAVAFCCMNLEIFKQCLAVVGVEKMIEKTTEKNRFFFSILNYVSVEKMLLQRFFFIPIQDTPLCVNSPQVLAILEEKVVARFFCDKPPPLLLNMLILESQ